MTELPPSVLKRIEREADDIFNRAYERDLCTDAYVEGAVVEAERALKLVNALRFYASLKWQSSDIEGRVIQLTEGPYPIGHMAREALKEWEDEK